MQRLFSMFPTGWPGIALLLLRIALGANVAYGILELRATLDIVWVLALLATVAIALCVGLLTPITATLAAFIEIVIWHFTSGHDCRAAYLRDLGSRCASDVGARRVLVGREAVWSTTSHFSAQRRIG